MAICETCGGKYTPTAEQPACPRCSARTKPARAASSPASGTMKARTATGRSPSSAALPAGPPAPRVRRVAAAEPEPEDAPRQIHHREPEGMLDQNAKLGLMVAGGLAVVVLGVVVVVMRKKAEERRIEEAYQNEVNNLYTELKTLNIDDETQAKQLLAKAKDKERRWVNHELAPQIQNLVARAGVSLETGKERRKAVGNFTEIENKLKDPSAISPESLNDLRRRLSELEAKISLGGEEYIARYAEARTTADKAFVTRKLEAAQQSSGTPRTALVDSQSAEDEIRKLLDQSVLEKKKELQDFYADLYKKAIAQSDQFATTLFTDKVISELPWTDCLAGEQLKYWNASSAKGFSHDPQPASLRIVGPDPDAGKQAVISIGDREQWRNFVLEMQFVIEKGNLELFLRLGRAPNANTISYPMMTESDQRNLKAGKPYHVIMKVLGSQWSIRYENDDDLDTPPPKEETITWAKTRKGAIGFLVPPGARFRATTFKVRELR
jgi:hypothetical protein